MLFGHQDNANQPVTPAAAAPQTTDNGSPANPLAVDPQTGASLPVVPPNSPGPVDTTEGQSVLNQGPSTVQDNADSVDSESLDAPAVDDPNVTDPNPTSPFGASPAPVADQVQAPAPVDTPVNQSLDAPAEDDVSEQMVEAPAAPVYEPTQPAPVMATPSVVPPAPAASIPDSDSLLDLKQQAITQLSPLVAHLEQSPEDKFRTTMMLIQSTDNSALLQQAYAAAQAIPDEKVRAQALLDIVNEINYFTQQNNQ